MTDPAVADNIKKELVRRLIKLWLPPYFGVSGTEKALVELAATFDDDEETNNTVVLHHLKEFQEHALEKLRAKGKLLDELNLKILGVVAPPQEEGASLFEAEEDNSQSCTTHTWAERLEQTTTSSSRNSNNNNSNFVLQLHRVNPELMLDTFTEQLATLLNAASLRLVHKGKSLRIYNINNNNNDSNDSADNADIRLMDAVSPGKATILCLVVAQSKLPALANSTDQQQQTSASADNDNDDKAVIDSIRTAAKQLQSTAKFDITDSQGNLVSMTHADRLAFLTALGLHALAKQKLQRHEENNNDDDENNNNNNNNLLQSALVFLLQADQEWNQLDASWRDRVDNYGLLQLDICWVYLKFEAVENLPHVLERLQRAETALRQQVDRNFVTLALVQADQNHPVPALAAIFVRLFLLQGVAQYYRARNSNNNSENNIETSRERLDWAWGLAKSLRAVSPEPLVARLCEAMAVTPFQAVSALRRTNGNIDQAAALIEKDDVDAAKASEQRYKQRKLGLCENGTDFVDLKLVEQLQTVLGLSSSSSSADDDDDDDNEALTSGLLRLSNNNLERALDLYQDAMRDNSSILRQVEALDQNQGVSSSRTAKRRRKQAEPDEMALASLVSMGVDDETAKRALAHNDNNVEMALLWLTNNNNQQEDSMMIHENNAPLSDSGEQQPSDTNLNREDLSDAESVDPQEGVQAAADAAGSSSDVASATPPQRSRAVSLSPRQVAEREAVALLEDVLGQVLEEQNEGGCDCIGSTLDEEWKYIEQYRGA